MKTLFLIFLFFVCPGSLFAQDLYSQEYSACIDQSGGNNFEMSECISQEYAVQDKKLNDVYKKLMNQLSEERKKVLRDAQRAWISYADKNCDFYNDPEGGTMASLGAQECMLSSRASRARELENFLK
jgi:uncharacterized protein YecT (DUF1311 family)